MADGLCFRPSNSSSPFTFMGFGKTFKTVAHLGITPKRYRKIRRKLGLTGKQIKRKLGLARVTSAGGLASDSVYGPTGSIVGRY